MRNLELAGRSPVHAPGGIDKPPLLVLAKNWGFRCILFRNQGLSLERWQNGINDTV